MTGEPASLRGRLVVATPAIADPNFTRSVVLVLEHGEGGAMGVVLNRPGEVDVAEHLPAWAGVVAHPPVVFVGGPVAPDVALCLARLGVGGEAEGWDPLVGPVGTVDLNLRPEDVLAGVEAVRIFAGYAGWSPGQLEAEIAGGGWFVVDADPADALSPRPRGLWPDVLRRQGGTLALFAAYPPDPTVN